VYNTCTHTQEKHQNPATYLYNILYIMLGPSSTYILYTYCAMRIGARLFGQRTTDRSAGRACARGRAVLTMPVRIPLSTTPLPRTAQRVHRSLEYPPTHTYTSHTRARACAHERSSDCLFVAVAVTLL